ncbi:MAG: hypothetical protein RLZZ245_1791 [Verrucomicrobiota bacterium]
MAASILVLLTNPTRAAEFVVTSTADSGAGSLRQAVADAAANAEADLIRFDPALANATISLSTDAAYANLLTRFGPTGLVIHADTVTLDGEDAPFLEISGATARRIFAVASTGTLILKNLTLTEGKAKGGKGGDGTGCGHGGGGGAGLGGAVWVEGSLEVVGCTFFDNHAIGGNGGAAGGQSGYSGTGGGGGGFGQDGKSGILGGAGASPGGAAGQNYGNGTAGAFGGGGGGGGGSTEYAPSSWGVGAAGGFGGGSGGWSFQTVPSAPLGGWGGSGETGVSSRSGGGGAALGGAVFVKNGTCRLVNSTFAQNTATGGADSTGSFSRGQGQGGAVFNYQGQVSILSCTMSQNVVKPLSSVTITGISGASETSGKGSFSVFNTIVVSSANAIVQGTVDIGFMFFNGGSFASVLTGRNAVTATYVGGNYQISGFAYSPAMLGPLADNGGPTLTILPESGSQVIDYGDVLAAAGLTVDQRGQPRFAANKLDVGAVQITLGPPGVEASAAVVNGLAADLSATVTMQGATEVTERGFVWANAATNPDPEVGGAGVTQVVNADAEVGQYATSIVGLAANTSYVFKSYAINSIGTAYSAPQSFTTNVAPVITSGGGGDAASLSIPENSIAVSTVIATDADVPQQALSYAIRGGADSSKFSIDENSGEISFVTAPDFDVPGDANGDGIYEVEVSVSDDGNTPRTDAQSLRISLSDVAEAPYLNTQNSMAVTPVRATLGGTVLNDGGAGDEGMITERGVVYAPVSLNETPTLSGAGCAHRTTGGTTGIFTLAVDELSPGTVYAYRAYATNASGTSYGPVATFTTGVGPVLNGDFWVQVAGNTAGSAGTTNGTGTAAKFDGPKGITADSNGDLFVADTLSHTARKIVGSSFSVSTVLGVAGTAGSNNTAFLTSEKFSSPSGIAAFEPPSGAMRYFIADTANHTVRLGTWTFLGGWNGATYAGTAGSAGSVDGTNAAARFLSPQGVAVDASGNVYVADTGNHAIRKITTNQVVTTVVPKLISTAAYWGISVPGLASSWNGSFTQLALSYGHVLGLRSDGTVAAWGINGVGETSVPAGLGGVTAVAAGHQHSLALKGDGTVVAWGLDTEGQSTVPAGLAGVTAIAARDYVSLALKNDGSVVAWGDNADGQTSVPADLSDVAAISAGSYHCLALKSDGAVVGWGDNSVGQSASTTQQSITNAVAIAAGGSHSMALLADGTVRCWGSNDSGQCNVPAGLTGVKAIGAGNYFSYALKLDGTLVSWGWNGAGVRKVPAMVTGRAVSSLAVGPSNVVVLMNEELKSPAGLAVDGSGHILISDTGNHVVRRYNPATGEIVLLAGRPGVAGATDGAGTAALLNGPRGITVDAGGNIYVTQVGDHTVRWITPDGRVRNVGGLPGTSGLANGAPEDVRFNAPGGVAAIGTTIYVADTGNHRIMQGSPLYRPMVGAGQASNITAVSATLNGWVNPNAKATTARFEYGIDDAFGTHVSVPLASGTAATGQIAQVDLSGLAPSTTYYFRLVATNVDGSAVTQTGSFVSGGLATLASPSSSNITASGAMMHGEILSDGGSSVVTRGFVYSVTSVNALPVLGGSGVTAVNSEGSASSFSVAVIGLEAGTTYRFRAYATNATGTSYSEAHEFTTAAFMVVFDNTAGKTESLGSEANGITSNNAFGYHITTGNEGVDLNSITLGLRDFDLATALQVRLFLSGGDSLPSGQALATQDYASRSFGMNPSYFTFPLSGFRLKANTSYILFVGASSGNVNWSRYEPNITPQSSIGWTVNSMVIDSYGNFYNMAGNPDRWSIQLTGIPFVAAAPSLGSPLAESITPTTAELGGAVTEDGGAGITEFGFVYAVSGLVTSPEINAANVLQVQGAGTSGNFTASLTGLAVATEYCVRAYAKNAAGTSYSDIRTFTTTDETTPVAAWRLQHFGTKENVGNAAELAMPDGDGIANLIKYGLCIIPGENSAGGLPAVSRTDDDRLALRFRRDPSRNDVNLVVEAQSDLGGTWSPIARSDAGGSVTGIAESTETANQDGTRTVEVKDSQTISAAPKRFLRVRVEKVTAGN